MLLLHHRVWVPSHRALCAGDFFIWAAPNCGNPQKAQRYPLEWSAALREMADKGADILFPGHGMEQHLVAAGLFQGGVGMGVQS